MALTNEEIEKIEQYLKSDSGPRWISAKGIGKYLGKDNVEYTSIDASLSDYINNTENCKIRNSTLPSRNDGLQVLWGHLSKVDKREVGSIYRQDDPSFANYVAHLDRVGRKPSIFISHSFKDTDPVIELVVKLEEQSIYSWIAELDIEHKAHINSSVLEAIDSCKYFGVYLSGHAIKSTWTDKEIKYALNNEKIIICFLDTSDDTLIDEINNALLDPQSQVRNEAFDRFFSPCSNVCFFNVHGEESTLVEFNSNEIIVKNLNSLQDLIKPTKNE